MASASATPTHPIATRQLRPVGPTKLLLFGNVYNLEQIASKALIKVLRLYRKKFPLALYGGHKTLGPLLHTLHELNDFSGDDAESSRDDMERYRRHILAFHAEYFTVTMASIRTGVVLDNLINAVNSNGHVGELTSAEIPLESIPDDTRVLLDNGVMTLEQVGTTPAATSNDLSAKIAAIRSALDGCKQNSFNDSSCQSNLEVSVASAETSTTTATASTSSGTATTASASQSSASGTAVSTPFTAWVVASDELRFKDGSRTAQKQISYDPTASSARYWSPSSLLDIAALLCYSDDMRKRYPANISHLAWVLAARPGVPSHAEVVQSMLALLERFTYDCRKNAECLPPPSRAMLKNADVSKIVDRFATLQKLYRDAQGAGGASASTASTATAP